MAFLDPFSGMLPDRPMNKEELIRALRLDLAAEEEAVHLYTAQADSTMDPAVATVLRDIAKEEIVHVGEFQKLILDLTGNDEADLLNKGAEEVAQKTNLLGVPVESKKERKMNSIFEAKDLQVYKKLLKVLGDYSDRFPGTGVSRMLDQALESGKKILPKDALAVDILHHILKTSSVPSAIHKILNLRFSGLPVELQPTVKNGRSKVIAHWTREALVSDKIKDLIDWSGSGKKGHWSDVDGNLVKLHDLKQEEE